MWFSSAKKTHECILPVCLCVEVYVDENNIMLFSTSTSQNLALKIILKLNLQAFARLLIKFYPYILVKVRAIGVDCITVNFNTVL